MSVRLLWIVFASAGVVLQVLILHCLLRGPFERFRLLVVYCAALLFISVFNGLQFFAGPHASWTAASQQYYWIGEMILQGLIYTMVIQFIHQAMGAGPSRDAMRRMMSFAAVFIASATLYLFHDARTAIWMTRVTLYLSFLSTLFSLLLWFVLLRFRTADRLLLALTCGLGMQMAGQAIGHAMRELARPTALGRYVVLAGNLVIVGSHLLCLYVWWRALREKAAAA